MLGALFAVLSAASFAFSNVATRRGVMGSSASYGLYVTVILGVPLFVIAAAATGQLLDLGSLSGKAVIFLVVAGIIHFLIGRYCNYRAVDAIGVNRTQPIQMTNIFYSILVAMVVLDESLTLLMGVGIGLLFLGPMIGVEGLRWRRRPSPAGDQSVSRTIAGGAPDDESPEGAIRAAVQPVHPRPFPRYAEGYTFAVLSATAYGSSPILIRSALEGTGLGILGGLISYSAAAGVLVVSLMLPGKIGELRSVKGSAVPMFLLTTVAIFLAQMFRFAALAVAPVTLVAPLARIGAVFNPMLNFVFNRQLESFNPRLLLAIVFSALGAVLMALEAG